MKHNCLTRFSLAPIAIVLGCFACSDEQDSGNGTEDDTAGECRRLDCPDSETDADGAETAGDGTNSEDAPTNARPPGTGALAGLVHFRLYDGQTLPVANPIVYWTLPEDRPEPFEGGLTCECGSPAGSVRGGVDGRFRMTDVPAGDVYLVIQKGRFRRSRLVNVPLDGTLVVPTELTELPVVSDPDNGDEIPDIVVGLGRYDSIEDVFAKLRMGPITSDYGFDYQEYMDDPTAWGISLALYQQPRELDDADWEVDAPDFLALLRDRSAMAEHNIIFAPCADVDRYETLFASESARDNVERFVYDGGKLYVTDYSYDVLEQPFAEYIDFRGPGGGDGNADGHVGEAEFMGIATEETRPYPSQNRSQDPQLTEWLETLGAATDGIVETEDNWVNVRGVDTVGQCCDDQGSWVDVTPEVVMSGPNRVPGANATPPTHETWSAAEAAGANKPHTLRFDYGCGEVMYSTYHTIDPRWRQPDLHPQELVLIYLIMEIGECNPEPIKEP